MAGGVRADDKGGQQTQTNPDVFPVPTDNGNTTQYGNKGSVVLMPDRSKPAGLGGALGRGFYDNLQTGISQAQAYYLTMTNDERERLQNYYDAFGKIYGYTKPKSLWNDIVEASADKGITPWQALEQIDADVKAGAVVPQAAAGSGTGGPRAFNNQTVNLTNPEDAQILVQNALSQYLGRNATEEELAAFTKALRKEEQASPQIDQGVSSRSGTSRVTTGGVSAAQAQEMAKDFAQSRPDYAEFQASTNLLDAFIGVLENKGRIV